MKKEKLFDYYIKVFYNKQDNDFVPYVEEIPEICAFGDKREIAVKELESAFTGWMKVAGDLGAPIPPPYY